MFGVIVLGITLIVAGVGLCVYIYQIFELYEEIKANPPLKVFMDNYRQVKRDRANCNL